MLILGVLLNEILGVMLGVLLNEILGVMLGVLLNEIVGVILGVLLNETLGVTEADGVGVLGHTIVLPTLIDLTVLSPRYIAGG